MKKAFSKVLVMLLTVCMLVSVFSVGISAATIYPYTNPGDYRYPVSLSLSRQSDSSNYPYYSNVVIGSLYDSNNFYSTGTWSWSAIGSSSVTISGSGSYAILTTTSSVPVTVTVYATVTPNVYGYPYTYQAITESISMIVYPDAYYYPGHDGFYDLIYGNGMYPYITSVVYVNGTPYPWCGLESSANCYYSGCIHNLIKSSYGISRDTTYCSSSCNYCGNPFNHHSLSWFINGGKDTSSTSTTVTPAKDVKLISAIERLAEFRKNQGKTEEKDTTETKKTPSKWINLYKDVDTKSWYYNYVRFVSENEYMKGKDTFEFGINTAVSRSEFAEALGKFANVKKDKAADYVKWAVDKGFLAESTSKKITKEEAVNAVYKYVVSLNKKVSTGSTKTDYSDADKVNADYKDAMNWAISNGLIGISANKISPTDPLVKTRLAQLLYNLNTYIG